MVWVAGIIGGFIFLMAVKELFKGFSERPATKTLYMNMKSKEQGKENHRERFHIFH